MIEIVSVGEYDDGYHFNGSGNVKRKLIIHDVKLNVNNLEEHVGTCQFLWLIVPNKQKVCTGLAFVSDDREFQGAWPGDVAEEIYNTLDLEFDENMNKLL